MPRAATAELCSHELIKRKCPECRGARYDLWLDVNFKVL
jgi:hypothetical protein